MSVALLKDTYSCTIYAGAPEAVEAIFLTISTYPISFKINCSSWKYPPTIVTWLRDNELLSSSTEYITYQIMEDGVKSTYSNILIVNGSSASGALYAGEYTCVLNNSFGLSTTNVSIQGVHINIVGQ